MTSAMQKAFNDQDTLRILQLLQEAKSAGAAAAFVLPSPNTGSAELTLYNFDTYALIRRRFALYRIVLPVLKRVH